MWTRTKCTRAFAYVGVILACICAFCIGLGFNNFTRPATAAFLPTDAHAPSIAQMQLKANKRYIVTLKPGTTTDSFNAHLARIQKEVDRVRAAAYQTFTALSVMPRSIPSALPRIGLERKYNIGNTYRAYTAHLDPETLEHVKLDALVDHVEEDHIVKIMVSTRGVQKQTHATWGLARISHRRHLNLDSPRSDDDSDTYTYPAAAGTGVHAYVIDTGILVSHQDFEGRAIWGKTICELEPVDMDLNGHGTHVAGTIAGARYGVAKNATLVAVKVMSGQGEGYTADIISGIEWVVNDHVRRKEQDARARSVINLSLGGPFSKVFNDAVNAAVAAGVHMAVAAGNDYNNACTVSPASAETAITVGATTVDDMLASFSNHGRCVDVLAPGQDITSDWNTDSSAVNTISGTSMASPHVCGLIALILSVHSEKDLTHKELLQHIDEMATNKTIHGMPSKHHHDGGWPMNSTIPERQEKGEGKTPNRLIYVLDPDAISDPNEHSNSKSNSANSSAKFDSDADSDADSDFDADSNADAHADAKSDSSDVKATSDRAGKDEPYPNRTEEQAYPYAPIPPSYSRLSFAGHSP